MSVICDIQPLKWFRIYVSEGHIEMKTNTNGKSPVTLPKT